MTLALVASNGASPIAGKPPAHDPEAEAAVLATCMLQPELAATLLAVASPRDFYSGAHRAIAEAAESIVAAGQTPDLTSVASCLRQTGRMSVVGKAGFLVEMTNQVAAISNPARYANTVRELAVVRRLTETLHRLLAESYEPIPDIPAFLAHVDATVAAVTKSHAMASVVTACESAKTVARVLSEPPRPTVTTGFRTLDDAVVGLEQRCLYILAGRTGMGKTALAMQIVAAAAASGHDVLVVTMEMPHEQLMRRMVATRSRVPMQAIRDRRISQTQWSAFAHAASELSRLPIHFSDKSGQTLLDVKAQIRTHKPALVVVDHIGLLRPAAGSAAAKRSREQEVAEFSRGLKSLALENGIPVMALCQVNRDVAKAARRPMMCDLRESGSIEQDADGIWFVHRPGYYDPKASPEVAKQAELIVAKQRDGGTFILPMEWDGETASFSEARYG